MKNIAITETTKEYLLLDQPADQDLDIEIAKNISAVIVETGYHPKVNITVQDNASVEYIYIYAGAGASVKQATLQRDASITWHTAIVGGENTHDISTIHEGKGSSSEHQGIFLGRERERFAMNYWSQHIGEHTAGHIYIHGVLFDKSYADFKGNIKIDQTGHDTDGSLTEETLLLGDRARSDSVPQLEIDTNDVQAAHASSITKIDDEQLFYLQSRLIPPDEGKRMIVRGFMESIIDRITVQEYKEQLISLIEERIKHV